MNISLTPIAFVKNNRSTSVDDNWQDITSEIILEDHVPDEVLLNIADFSHLEIIYFFNKVIDDQIIYSGKPRGNPDYPVTGIFAQRKKDRPNKLGLCTVELVSTSARTITVKRLDAINGTPVLDIKPVFKEFLPASHINQPLWANDLMKNYW